MSKKDYEIGKHERWSSLRIFEAFKSYKILNTKINYEGGNHYKFSQRGNHITERG
jgi:hypothetical protein